MIPLVGKVGDDLRKKYGNTQNLPIIEQEKPSLSKCANCERFEQGKRCGRVPPVNWCVVEYFDRIKKRAVTCYRNIELMDCCPKKGKKR